MGMKIETAGAQAPAVFLWLHGRRGLEKCTPERTFFKGNISAEIEQVQLNNKTSPDRGNAHKYKKCKSARLRASGPSRLYLRSGYGIQDRRHAVQKPPDSEERDHYKRFMTWF